MSDGVNPARRRAMARVLLKLPRAIVRRSRVKRPVTSAASSGPLDRGPGGPILVVTDPSNPFTSFYAEILRTEGFNEFATGDLSTVTASTLAGHDIVILGDTSLTDEQVTMLGDWVGTGGKLIAMRPSKALAPLLGIVDSGVTLADGYLEVDTSSGPGVGITAERIQYHGVADRYTLDGAAAVATLCSDASSRTGSPAVTIRRVDSHGGQAAAFTFDLARSVVTTRQGNPAWVGQARTGQPIVRSNDLFLGGSTRDPQPDWVDLDKVAIPQADEQQRLLGNLITVMTQDRAPLPRFWYFPHGKKAVVLLTGDDHANGGTAARFEQLLRLSPPGCVVDDWECLRMSSYIYPGTPITDAQAARYTAEGFEIGTHVTVSGTGAPADFTPSTIATAFVRQLRRLAVQLPSIPPAVSERLHCVPWSDWVSVPKTELAHGIRLDTTYYFWPPSWVGDRPGFFTGSGMVMRFADTDGTMIDTYQAATQLTDESDQTYPATIDTLLDNAIGPLGYYGVFTVNAHTDMPTSSVSDAVVASALARGVPVVSGRQLLTWIDARNASSFRAITWNGSNLGFTVSASAAATGLQALLPIRAGDGKTLTALTKDGAVAPHTVETIKGIQYARFASASGEYIATYGTTTPRRECSRTLAARTDETIPSST
jgi:hypothetical protein